VTSYTFHADTILESLPKARRILLLRNPLDIASSLRTRASAAAWLGMCLEWRQSVYRFETLLQQHLKRILLITHEQPCLDPTASIRRIRALSRIRFNPEMLRVGLVNTAEEPYRTASVASGISMAKLVVFQSQPSHSQQSSVLELFSRSLVYRYYPDLATIPPLNRTKRLQLLVPILLTGVANMLADLQRRLMAKPYVTVTRSWQRLRRSKPLQT